MKVTGTEYLVISMKSYNKLEKSSIHYKSLIYHNK